MLKITILILLLRILNSLGLEIIIIIEIVEILEIIIEIEIEIKRSINIDLKSIKIYRILYMQQTVIQPKKAVTTTIYKFCIHNNS